MKNSIIIFIISFFALLFLRCTKKEEAYFDPRGVEYAGAESCIQCHKTINESNFHTSHANATAPASIENVWGDFDSGKAVFAYDDHSKLVMETRNDSLYQVLYKDGKEVGAYKLEIVFGFKHAQTSVYWKDNNTFELPISYYKSIDNWATSPGFSTKTPLFDRKIVNDCYACHSSNIGAKAKSTQDSYLFGEDFEDFINKETIIYGIDCERCHGPAKKHVDYHVKFPNMKIAQEMVSYKSLSNQQKLDACAICHSGGDGAKIKSRFEFKPGNKLLDFYRQNVYSKNDVHGNQAGFLSQSQCFIKSETLNCTTCHNPHENASKNIASYSKICISCHQTTNHTETTVNKMAGNLKNDCVACHMPKQASNAIRFQLSNNPEYSKYYLNTHKIAIYPEIK